MSTVARPAPVAQARPGALTGLRILEFGAFAAGPAIGKHLADQGAEVIRVESRQRMDGFRTNYPPYRDNRPDPETAGMFAMTNDNKLGVTLNLKVARARELARRLSERADVVIENFTPGTLDKLGLGYAVLREGNPGLVMLSTCNQGATGPHAQRAGFGTQLTALGGFTHLTGWPDRAPALLWGPFIDYIAVAYGAVAVLAALEERDRTGCGSHVDLSQLETGIQMMAPALLQHELTGRIPVRDGNRHPEAAPHGVFPCAGSERWIAISVHDDGEWARFRAAIGDPDWAGNGRFASAGGRKQHEDELEARLAGWTSGRQREEVVDLLRRAEVHVAPVNDMRDLFEDEQLVHRRAFRTLEHEYLGPHTVPGPPFRLSETPDVIERPAFLLGEHNRTVLQGILGVDDETLANLEREGALD